MGILQNGRWVQQDFAGRNKSGHYVRAGTQFRNKIHADKAKESADARFIAASGRYHLFVAHACPWAYRTMVLRALKGLENAIGVSYVDPMMLENGWHFGDQPDPVTGANYMYNIYAKADPDYSGRCSVPVLWDRQSQTIVNNESADIVRILNKGFDAFATKQISDLYPTALRPEIDKVNELVYKNVNNGVYRCGFATSQQAYESAFDKLFAALDKLESRLSTSRYLCGETITEADWRLFATLIRFDPVYHGHFKCNKHRICDFPNLWNYTLELYQVPGIADITDMAKIKQHYYGSHDYINPFRIVPKGPEQDLTVAHDRGRLTGLSFTDAE